MIYLTYQICYRSSLPHFFSFFQHLIMFPLSIDIFILSCPLLLIWFYMLHRHLKNTHFLRKMSRYTCIFNDLYLNSCQLSYLSHHFTHTIRTYLKIHSRQFYKACIFQLKKKVVTLHLKLSRFFVTL